MSNKWCTTTNKEWQVLQKDMSSIIVNIGDLTQGIEDWFKQCNACGCESCIKHIDLIKKRLGPFWEYAGSLHKETTKVIGYVKD